MVGGTATAAGVGLVESGAASDMNGGRRASISTSGAALIVMEVTRVVC